MTPNEYQKAALRTCNMLDADSEYSAPIRSLLIHMIPGLTSGRAARAIRLHRNFFEVWNGVLGLNGEAGECIDIFKKCVFQGHNFDEKHMAEELGDVAWYLATTAHAIGYDLEDIFKMNIEKLKARYPDGFDSERSIHRPEYGG